MLSAKGAACTYCLIALSCSGGAVVIIPSRSLFPNLRTIRTLPSLPPPGVLRPSLLVGNHVIGRRRQLSRHPTPAAHARRQPLVVRLLLHSERVLLAAPALVDVRTVAVAIFVAVVVVVVAAVSVVPVHPARSISLLERQRPQLICFLLRLLVALLLRFPRQRRCRPGGQTHPPLKQLPRTLHLLPGVLRARRRRTRLPRRRHLALARGSSMLCWLTPSTSAALSATSILGVHTRSALTLRRPRNTPISRGVVKGDEVLVAVGVLQLVV
mmetsp:Transcript_11027/g.21006  ORF Transcript_11027/g.21006 Transcript_11027/m.21006 type:complete len:269 (-) Transcript_11027:523-1329(-)